jgi:hypothetical protein
MWITGDRARSFELSKPADYPTFDALRDFARGSHACMEERLARLDDEGLAARIAIPWFKPPFEISVAGSAPLHRRGTSMPARPSCPRRAPCDAAHTLTLNLR